MPYIILLFVTCLCVWWILQYLSPHAKKRLLQCILVAGFCLIAFFLLRVSPYAAALLAAVTTLTIFVNRFLTAWSLYTWFKRILSPSASSSIAANGKNSMTRQEASDILGVSAHASQQEILVAYKRLMKKNHPDLGGTTKIAEQINLAKDILLTK